MQRGSLGFLFRSQASSLTCSDSLSAPLRSSGEVDDVAIAQCLEILQTDVVHTLQGISLTTSLWRLIKRVNPRSHEFAYVWSSVSRVIFPAKLDSRNLLRPVLCLAYSCEDEAQFTEHHDC